MRREWDARFRAAAHPMQLIDRASLSRPTPASGSRTGLRSRKRMKKESRALGRRHSKRVFRERAELLFSFISPLYYTIFFTRPASVLTQNTFCARSPFSMLSLGCFALPIMSHTTTRYSIPDELARLQLHGIKAGELGQRARQFVERKIDLL